MVTRGLAYKQIQALHDRCLAQVMKRVLTCTCFSIILHTFNAIVNIIFRTQTWAGLALRKTFLWLLLSTRKIDDEEEIALSELVSTEQTQ